MPDACHDPASRIVANGLEAASALILLAKTYRNVAPHNLVLEEEVATKTAESAERAAKIIEQLCGAIEMLDAALTKATGSP